MENHCQNTFDPIKVSSENVIHPLMHIYIYVTNTWCTCNACVVFYVYYMCRRYAVFVCYLLDMYYTRISTYIMHMITIQLYYLCETCALQVFYTCIKGV